MPLKTRMLFLVSVILIIGFLSTTLVSYFVSRDSLKSEVINHQLPITSDNIYSEIQRDLLRPIFVSSLMASDSFVRDWVIKGEKNHSDMDRYLKTIKDRYGAFTSFFVSDRTQNYYHADGLLKKVSPDNDRDKWYYRVRDMTENYEINVDPDLANDDTVTIFINYKVFDFNDNFIGVTGVGLQVASVKKIIKHYQKRYHRQVYFVDKEGVIKLWGDLFDSNQTDFLQRAGVSAIAAAVLETEGGTFEYNLDGDQYILGSRYIPELGWHLIVEQSVSEIYQPLDQALYTNLVICLVIIMIALGMTNYTINFFQSNLEKMALTDKLTGIDNRYAFSRGYIQVLREMKRNRKWCCLIIFDADYFKGINDRFGHLVGDEVLRQITAIAKSNIREVDIFCRWGGEEFLILLSDCDETSGMEIAEKIRGAISNQPIKFAGLSIPVTVSLGVTSVGTNESEDSAVARVDKALLRAKELGRNRIELETIGAKRSYLKALGG
jgi:diguanylate cyclase (GGDEF)-like protein